MFIDARDEVKQQPARQACASCRATPPSSSRAKPSPSTPRIALRRYPGPKFAIVTPRNDAPLSLHNAVPGVSHTVIKGTGHWIHLDKPDEFNQTLDGLLKQL